MVLKATVALAVFLAAAGVVFAADEVKSLTLTDVPAAVQKTITAQVADGQLGDIDQTNEDGGTVFEVNFTPKAGEEKDFTVADDGTLLGVEMTFAEVPPAVQKTILTQATGAALESIDKNLDDVEISYDVAVTQDGKPRTFIVADDGDLLSEEVSLATTPAPVQDAIKTKIGEGTFESVDEVFQPEGNTFDVEAVAKGGKTVSFSVSATGQLLSEEVPLAKLPPAARKSVENRLGDGKLIRIDKSLSEKKDGVLPYQVSALKDGKPFNFSVGPRGRFLGMDQGD